MDIVLGWHQFQANFIPVDTYNTFAAQAFKLNHLLCNQKSSLSSCCTKMSKSFFWEVSFTIPAALTNF